MSNWDFGFTDPAAGHSDPWESPASADADAWDETDLDPYPLTYERGPGQPAAQPPAAGYQPWPAAPFPGEQPPAAPFPADEFAGGRIPAAQASSGQFTHESWLHAPASGPQPAGAGPAGWPGGTAGAGGQSGDDFSDEFDGTRGATSAFPGGEPGGRYGSAEPGGPWRPGHGGRGGRHDGHRGRRWAILAGVAAAGTAAGVSAVVLSSGRTGTPATGAAPSTAMASRPAASHPAAPRPAAPATRPPVTMAQAQGVLASYTAVNNSANATRDAVRLATIETGSSFAIDAGLYRVQQAAGAAPYPAFGPASAAYYIPRAEPAGGPRWFAVQVANTFFSSPGKITSTEYLLFIQAVPGGPWRNAVEPYLLPGASAPQIAVGSDGLATAVSPAAASLAAAPGQLAAQTAGSLDGTGQAGTAVTTPGDLADQSDQRFWHGKLPTATVTDTHTPAAGTAGQAFALLTTDGGALVFCTDAAELTITPPPGTMLHLTVPGLYSPAPGLPRAGLAYLDQFAVSDPPANTGTPRVIAEYSGLTGKN